MLDLLSDDVFWIIFFLKNVMIENISSKMFSRNTYKTTSLKALLGYIKFRKYKKLLSNCKTSRLRPSFNLQTRVTWLKTMGVIYPLQQLRHFISVSDLLSCCNLTNSHLFLILAICLLHVVMILHKDTFMH